ncbi:MAG: methylenetetrahydrofolate--tRNA-(uracil(54)-C(5))-methyltransferase (FADH(2)-oxidizing) TrmFO, partial [Gemmatimonadaceae bacterium]
MHDEVVTVVGGGLAGSEAAWQLAQRGHDVALHEMRPVRQTDAHRTDRLAELVCSNTFKSTELSTAHGAIKAEMRELGCLVLDCADLARVAAGSALAVDRDVFAAAVTERITSHPRITVVRGEIENIPTGPAIIATGPLTGEGLATALRERFGAESLAFYDAIAPVVSRESIDESRVFTASRYGKETMDGATEGAYLNCPMDRQEYEAFVTALDSADQFHGHEFDKVPYFSGCMPVEEMNSRGHETLRFGPLKPVGLSDPRTGVRPYAVVQLRREDRAGRLWNL